jgi:hypothetical protein
LHGRFVQEAASRLVMLQQFLNVGPELLILPAFGVQECSPLGRISQLGRGME